MIGHQTSRLLFLGFILLLAQKSFAQKQRSGYLEAGVMLGLTNYSGDMSERFIEPKAFNPAYGAFVRYRLTPYFALKLHGYSGSISGDDADSKTRQVRSFRFSTSIVELALLGELHLFQHPRFSKTGIHKSQISPYLYGGVGVTFADAEAQYYGLPEMRSIFLKTPLPEQGLSNRFVLVPVGGGIRFDVMEQLVIGVEGGIRPVFSDDLDGVHINGNPKQGDWYYYGGVTISIILNNGGKKYPF